MFNFTFVLLLHLVSAASNFGSCIFDTTTTPLVYQTIQINNSIANKTSFYIEQNQGKKYVHRNRCINGDEPRLWKCLVQNPLDHWDLNIKDEKNVTFYNSSWYFNTEECICLNIKPDFELKIEINDPEKTSSLYKISCNFHGHENMLSVVHRTVYLDFGNENKILQDTCASSSPSVSSSFSINSFNISTPCKPIKICSKTKFRQCSNEGGPSCVVFNRLSENDFLLKYFDCKINSGSLQVNWNFRNILERFSLNMFHVSLNFQQGKEIVLSKNISSASGRFVDGATNNMTMHIHSCFHCQCFRSEKICFYQNKPRSEKIDPDDGLKTKILIIVSCLLSSLIFIFCIYFCCTKKSTADINQNPIFPRNQEIGNINPENIYEEVPDISQNVAQSNI